MKNVRLMGKVALSWGMAVSLLLFPANTSNCFANFTSEVNKEHKAEGLNDNLVTKFTKLAGGSLAGFALLAKNMEGNNSDKKINTKVKNELNAKRCLTEKSESKWEEILKEAARLTSVFLGVGLGVCGYSYILYKCLDNGEPKEFKELKQNLKDGVISPKEFYTYAINMTNLRQQRHLNMFKQKK